MQIAEEACEVEISFLGSAIGKQDQYAAAFGGLNYFEFQTNGKVKIEPLYLSKVDMGRLLDRSVLVWTGQSRKADDILKDQAGRATENYNHLLELSDLANSLKEHLLQRTLDWSEIGRMISQGWEIKQTLSPKIVTPEVQAIASRLEEMGCYGYKLLGAGGGGFMFALIEDPQKAILGSLGSWSTFRPELDHIGARIVSLK